MVFGKVGMKTSSLWTGGRRGPRGPYKKKSSAPSYVTVRPLPSKVKSTRKFKKAVREVVHRMAENKCVFSTATNQDLVNIQSISAYPATLTSGNLINCLPLIAQGVSQAQRVGNEVSLRYAYIKGYVNLKPYSGTLPVNLLSCPLIVKMYLVSWKFANRAYATPDTLSLNNFFQTGSSSTGFSGGVLDTIQTVNQDVWTVHKMRQFELTLNNAGLTSTGQPMQNPTGVMSKKFYFRIDDVYKRLRYDDQTSNNVTNHNLWLITQVVRADGSTDNVANFPTYAENHYCISWQYEDL